MQRLCVVLVLTCMLAIGAVPAAVPANLAAYDVEGISLEDSIQKIEQILKDAGYEVTPPDTLQGGAFFLKWKFEKPLDDGGSSKIVVKSGDVTRESDQTADGVLSIDMEIEGASFDLKSEYDAMVLFAGSQAKQCSHKQGKVARCKFTIKQDGVNYWLKAVVRPDSKSVSISRK